MGEQELRRAAKEHAAAVQAYMDAGKTVSETIGRVAALIANEEGNPEFYTDMFHKADRAAALIDEAFYAVRNALEPDTSPDTIQVDNRFVCPDCLIVLTQLSPGCLYEAIHAQLHKQS